MLGEIGALERPDAVPPPDRERTRRRDTDHLLAAELAARISRPDLGVMVGRSARTNGLNDYVASGYPTVPIPPQHQRIG